MSTLRHLLAAVLVLGSLCLLPNMAHAAQSYDSCAGFIDTLPATISTQGVWCLRHDLATSMASGNAIVIYTNNVTIDCNDFKIGGLGAGNGSNAFGIYAVNRQNITIRHCNVRGFLYGIYLSGAGHLVEDNQLDNNLYTGIYVSGEHNRVRRNAVYDTGGLTGNGTSYGISAFADIVDNTVSGLFADTSGGVLYGIYVSDIGAQVRDNKIAGFDMIAAQGGAVGRANGIFMANTYQSASGNQVTGGGYPAGSTVYGVGIWAEYGTSFCIGNSVGGFGVNINSSCVLSGNVTSN